MSARQGLWTVFWAVVSATGFILATVTSPAAGAHARATWAPADQNYAGPRFVCGASQRITLQYGDKSYPLDAIEAANNLLVPARAFTILGADVKWEGGRRVNVALGSRAVAFEFGSHMVHITVDGKTSDGTWNLCPRQHNDTAYVPLRAMAEALGFGVKWDAGVATLEGVGEASAATAPAECPASKLETALGFAVIHAPAPTSFGPGVGVTSVQPGGNAEKMGLHPKDIIIECNGKRVSCPRELEAIVSENQPGSETPCGLTIVRDAAKMTLQCAMKTQ